MKITAIILNGRHGGFMYFEREYTPTIKLPIVSENQISIGEKYDNSVRMGDFIEYEECFRSVDKGCVIYSTHGRWEEIKDVLHEFDQTYPINLFKALGIMHRENEAKKKL